VTCQHRKHLSESKVVRTIWHGTAGTEIMSSTCYMACFLYTKVATKRAKIYLQTIEQS